MPLEATVVPVIDLLKIATKRFDGVNQGYVHWLCNVCAAHCTGIICAGVITRGVKQ